GGLDQPSRAYSGNCGSQQLTKDWLNASPLTEARLWLLFFTDAPGSGAQIFVAKRNERRMGWHGMSGKITLSDSERSNLAWRKAQRSTANGQCVELASAVGNIAIRDSKDPDGPVLVYTSAEFSAFLEGARNGEFDSLVR